MTKLPKRLEKVIEQKAEAYIFTQAGSQSKTVEQDFINGGTDIALVVLKEAQKLVEALRFCQHQANKAGIRVSSAEKALSGWKDFVEGE